MVGEVLRTFPLVEEVMTVGVLLMSQKELVVSKYMNTSSTLQIYFTSIKAGKVHCKMYNICEVNGLKHQHSLLKFFFFFNVFTSVILLHELYFRSLLKMNGGVLLC